MPKQSKSPAKSAPAKRTAKRTAPSTPAERKALAAERTLAQKIAKLRDAGRKYDGDGGICEMPGFPKSAIRCRALLRKHGLDANRIGPAYTRTPEFRAAESARRTAKAAKPTPKPRKATGKATAKRTAAKPRKRTARAS